MSFLILWVQLPIFLNRDNKFSGQVLKNRYCSSGIPILTTSSFQIGIHLHIFYQLLLLHSSISSIAIIWCLFWQNVYSCHLHLTGSSWVTHFSLSKAIYLASVFPSVLHRLLSQCWTSALHVKGSNFNFQHLQGEPGKVPVGNLDSWFYLVSAYTQQIEWNVIN